MSNVIKFFRSLFGTVKAEKSAIGTLAFNDPLLNTGKSTNPRKLLSEYVEKHAPLRNDHDFASFGQDKAIAFMQAGGKTQTFVGDIDEVSADVERFEAEAGSREKGTKGVVLVRGGSANSMTALLSSDNLGAMRVVATTNLEGYKKSSFSIDALTANCRCKLFLTEDDLSPAILLTPPRLPVELNKLLKDAE